MDGVEKAKAQLELKVVRDTQGKKSFWCYVNSKRLNKENVNPLVNKLGDFVIGGTDKPERLNVIFASVFTRKVSHASVLSERLGGGGE